MFLEDVKVKDYTNMIKQKRWQWFFFFGFAYSLLNNCIPDVVTNYYKNYFQVNPFFLENIYSGRS